MLIVEPREFTQDEHLVWHEVVTQLARRRAQQIHPMFDRGLEALHISANKIPDLREVNKILKARTGFEGVYVRGLEDGSSFYPMLKDRKFPIGCFVRDRRDLNYTPEPDILHDFYGHMPFLASANYAQACQRVGEITSRHLVHPAKLRMCERFFWFTFEFALVLVKNEKRIFGAGIASSISECDYALSDQPEILPFDVERICLQEFKIDEMQKTIFMLESEQQLYNSLDKFEAFVANGQ